MQAQNHALRPLFITWDGSQTDYLRSLYFPLFEKTGLQFSVLQFRKGGRSEAIAESASRHGIAYRGLDAHNIRTKLAATYQITKAASDFGATLLLPRSHIPATMCLPLVHRPFVFEADGAMPLERVETGVWSFNDPRKKAAELAEIAILRRAQHVITRTKKAQRYWIERGASSVSVVANGARDKEWSQIRRFDRRAFRKANGIPPNALWLVSVGSVGKQYLPEKQRNIAEALAAHQNVYLTVLTGDQEAALKYFSGNDPRYQLTVRRVAPSEVAAFLMSSDLGLALRKKSPSQEHVSPIKIAEYLMNGLPLIYSPGVGDLDSELRGCSAAFAFGESSSTEEVAAWVLKNTQKTRKEAHRIGKERFSLEKTARRYRNELGKGDSL